MKMLLKIRSSCVVRLSAKHESSDHLLASIVEQNLCASYSPLYSLSWDSPLHSHSHSSSSASTWWLSGGLSTYLTDDSCISGNRRIRHLPLSLPVNPPFRTISSIILNVIIVIIIIIIICPTLACIQQLEGLHVSNQEIFRSHVILMTVKVQ